ncbi:MAG: extracellular solute-binding protein, partial [Lachnospiraceae bacterium]|nr:extracellular solute-binding protein [Lachnospiraceae bacterium]
MKGFLRRFLSVLLVGTMVFSLFACQKKQETVGNLADNEEQEQTVINLFGPMEKSKPDLKNAARNAFDQTVIMAEERLGLQVEYRTYTAENYQEKTYDDVTLDRVRSHMDDLYLLNPDTIQMLGSEGKLADLSGLACAKNLRDVVKTANTVDGKLVAIPQEVVAHGLFINKDLFDQYELAIP